LAEVEALAKAYAAPSPPEIREGRLNVCSMNASVDSPAYAVVGVQLRSISAGPLAVAVIPVGTVGGVVSAEPATRLRLWRASRSA
jgi:hypothetical protein